MALRIYTGSSSFQRDTYFLLEEAKTKPDTQKSSSNSTLQPIAITEIPKSMRRMGWKKSAAFMERWLTSPAWKCPEGWKDGSKLPAETLIPAAHCDEDTITMSWLMGYPSAVKAVNELLAKCCSTASMAMTAKRLRRLGWDGHGSYTFGRKNIIGRPSMSARELEQYYQNNYLSVGSNAASHMIFDTLDDIYGALGTYALKCAIFGTAYFSEGKRYLNAEWTGVYVKDFYDFNNDSSWDQPLGLWTEAGIVTKSRTGISIINGMRVYTGKKFQKISAVFNSDFLKYREKTGKGGDFIVFSDVYWKKISGTYILPWQE